MTDISTNYNLDTLPDYSIKRVVEEAARLTLDSLPKQWQKICKRVRIQYRHGEQPVWDIHFLFKSEELPEIPVLFTTGNMGMPRYHWKWFDFTAEDLANKICNGFHIPTTSDNVLGIQTQLDQKIAELYKKKQGELEFLEKLNPMVAGFETLAPDYLNHPYELAVRPKRDVTGVQLMLMLRAAGYATGKVDVWKKLIKNDDPHINLHSWACIDEVEGKVRAKKQTVISSHSFDCSKLITEIFGVPLNRVWILVSLPVGEGG